MFIQLNNNNYKKILESKNLKETTEKNKKNKKASVIWLKNGNKRLFFISENNTIIFNREQMKYYKPTKNNDQLIKNINFITKKLQSKPNLHRSKSPKPGSKNSKPNSAKPNSPKSGTPPKSPKSPKLNNFNGGHYIMKAKTHNMNQNKIMNLFNEHLTSGYKFNCLIHAFVQGIVKIDAQINGQKNNTIMDMETQQQKAINFIKKYNIRCKSDNEYYNTKDIKPVINKLKTYSLAIYAFKNKQLVHIELIIPTNSTYIIHIKHDEDSQHFTYLNPKNNNNAYNYIKTIEYNQTFFNSNNFKALQNDNIITNNKNSYIAYRVYGDSLYNAIALSYHLLENPKDIHKISAEFTKDLGHKLRKNLSKINNQKPEKYSNKKFIQSNLQNIMNGNYKEIPLIAKTLDIKINVIVYRQNNIRTNEYEYGNGKEIFIHKRGSDYYTLVKLNP